MESLPNFTHRQRWTMPITEIRSLLREGKWNDAWSAFEAEPERGTEELLAGSLVARALYRESVGDNAQRWLYRAHVLVEEASNKLQGQPQLHHVEVHFHKARVEIDVGDWSDAYTSLVWLLNHGAEAIGTTWPVVEPETHFMMGLVCCRKGEPILGNSHYVEAARLAEAEGQHEVRLRCLQNLAWVALNEGNADRADEYLHQADILVGSQEDRWHQEIRRAYAMHLRGAEAEATTQLQRLHQEARHGSSRVSAEIMAWVCWLSGCIAANVGALNEAEQFVMDGQSWAIKGGDCRVMTDLCKLGSEVRAQRTAISG